MPKLASTVHPCTVYRSLYKTQAYFRLMLLENTSFKIVNRGQVSRPGSEAWSLLHTSHSIANMQKRMLKHKSFDISFKLNANECEEKIDDVCCKGVQSGCNANQDLVQPEQELVTLKKKAKSRKKWLCGARFKALDPGHWHPECFEDVMTLANTFHHEVITHSGELPSVGWSS